MIRPRIIFVFAGFILLLLSNRSQQSVVAGATIANVQFGQIVAQPTPKGTKVPGATSVATPDVKQKTGAAEPTLPPTTPVHVVGGTAVAPLKEESATGPASRWANTENYLILGTDRRPGWTQWRTDTIILVGLDRAQGKAAVLSIPRDLWVQIPNYGWGRINQVDYIGEQKAPGNGPAFVSEVLSQTLGIATTHWTRIQLDGFTSMIDAVGGVTVHLDCPFYETIFNDGNRTWTNFSLPAGDIHLDGATANWYVRFRYRESDIGRAARQRQVLWALRDQAVNGDLIARVPQLWSAFQNTFETDLGLLDMIGLARFSISLDKSMVRAGGIALTDLQSYRTPQGADVLRIANPNRMRAVVNGVWDAPEMVNSRQQDVATCKPLPTGIKYVQGPPPANLTASNQPTDTVNLTDTRKLTTTVKTGKP